MKLFTTALIVVAIQLGSTSQLKQASLQGSVFQDPSPSPLPGMTIQLIGNSKTQSTVSDNNGRFSFQGLQPGKYRLLASGPGKITTEYGQRSPGAPGLPIVLIPGESRVNVSLSISAYAAIEGQLRDSDREPAAGVLVRVLSSAYVKGERVLSAVDDTVTDDRGHYRFDSLNPGGYWIVALAPDFRNASVVVRGQSGPGRLLSAVPHFADPEKKTIHVPTFFPGTMYAQDATTIDVRPGDERTGVNFALANPISAVSVRGRILNEISGMPLKVAVNLLPDGNSTLVGGGSAVTDTDDGGFEFRGVLPGSYRMLVRFSVDSPTTETLVSVGTNEVSDLIIRLTPNFGIDGKVTVLGSPSGTSFPAYIRQVRLEPAISGNEPSHTGTISTDGSFRISGIPAGDYTVKVLPLQGPVPSRQGNAYIQSIRLGSVDVLQGKLNMDASPEIPLEISVNLNGAEIDGTVTNEKRSVQANITVVLVPVAPRNTRLDLYKMQLSDSVGVFHLQGISPGDYRLYAWSHAPNGAWENAEFVKPYEKYGKPVHIAEGDRQSIDLLPLDDK